MTAKRGKVLLCLSAFRPTDSCSIVFSLWKLTLDLIPLAQEASGLGYAHLDGGLAKSQRSKSLNAFRTDPDIIVLPATLSVAGLG